MLRQDSMPSRSSSRPWPMTARPERSSQTRSPADQSPDAFHPLESMASYGTLDPDDRQDASWGGLQRNQAFQPAPGRKGRRNGKPDLPASAAYFCLMS